MAEFAHFPSEILSCITQGLDGFDIANMWLSGDSGLRARMESGGVTRFKVNLRQERTRKWPNLVSRFRYLQALSIGPKEAHIIWFSEVDLLGVSPTLKHLELRFENVEMILLGIPFVVEDLHPDPNLSPPTTGEMSLSPLPIADHFKELQTLVLKGKPSIPHILVSQLPQTLLRLSLPCNKINKDVFRSLLPHLTSLELPNIAFLEEGLFLPPGLTRLFLPGLRAMPSGMLARIPSSLTDLTLHTLGLEVPDISLVPPNLTSLSMKGALFLGRSDENFPQSLRSLKIAKIPLTSSHSLPPNLQTLCAHNQDILPSISIGFFPQSMTKLTLKGTSVSLECLKIFPTNLRSLGLSITFPACQPPFGFMKTLEKLYVLKIGSGALEFAPRLSKIFCHSFVGNDFRALRRLSQLRYLLISDGVDITRKFLRSLPDGLEKLDLSTNQKIDPAVTAQYLPCSLQSLSIQGHTTLNATFIELLPPRLTILILTSVASISDASIRLLPRTLEVFILQDDGSQLTDEAIGQLPPSLTHCCFENTHLLTDKSASLFPRCMTNLHLSQCINLSNNAIPHFPRTLVSLDLPGNDKITLEECIPHLPPLLDYFITKNIQRYSWRPKVSPTSKFITSLIQKQE